MPMPPAKARAIADELAAAIRRGDHPPGDWLPSERELARQHEADRSTIRNAIALLVEQGLVRRIPRQGVQVCDPAAAPAPAGPEPEPEIACGSQRCCRTLAGMTSWLASQDRLTLVRVADISTVQVVVSGEPDQRLHPAKRLDRAEEVQVMVGSTAGVTMCAATCPGRDALWAREELLRLVSTLRRTPPSNEEMYVLGPASWPRRRPEQVWVMSSNPPQPE